MKQKKTGSRHPLLIYRRTVDRLFIASFIFGSLLFMIWAYPILGGVESTSDTVTAFVFISSVIVISISLFAFLARFRAFAQVYRDHLKLVTPFLRLNISFRRIQSAHPVLFQQLFPKDEMNWSQRSYLEPFWGKTAVVIELKGYPMRRGLLRLFLPSVMFSPQTTGFVLLVPDWMKFSTELDTFHGKWLGVQKEKSKLPGRLD